MAKLQFERFFSDDSAKAVKARGYGYLNAINYMAPHTVAGVGNMCPHATDGCKALCLGLESGQAAMVGASGTNNVRESRKRKARWFMADRAAFMREMIVHIGRLERKARLLGLTLVVRLNGSTDIAWEGIRVDGKNVFEMFPHIQFVDYTKNVARMRRALPANYSLTFSRSEGNSGECGQVLLSGGNVAVVFANALPEKWYGYTVIDGDKHDLRHLDQRGVVVGLSPKGAKAKRDMSGFVVRA